MSRPPQTSQGVSCPCGELLLVAFKTVPFGTSATRFDTCRCPSCGAEHETPSPIEAAFVARDGCLGEDRDGRGAAVK